jgi:hypothetical protein
MMEGKERILRSGRRRRRRRRRIRWKKEGRGKTDLALT